MLQGRGAKYKIHTGLDRPGSLAYRELLKRDFEARLGGGAPGRALADVVRRFFAPDRK